MRIEIPQMFWHGDRDRIMSIDFYPNSNYLVTCGAEYEDKMWIKFWELCYDIGADDNNYSNLLKTTLKSSINENSNHIVNLIEDNNQNRSLNNKVVPKFKYELAGAHTSTVNILRFSPDGMYLATGGDDSAIVLWVQKIRPKEFGSNIEEVLWSNYKVIRGHLSDIYDLAWSPDSKYIVSGSVDNSTIVFSVEKGKVIQKFNDHSNFVQGVSWDPRNKFLVSQSSDKSARVYKNAIVKQDIKFYFAHQIKKNSVFNIEDEKVTNKVNEKVNEIVNVIDNTENKMEIDNNMMDIDKKINKNLSGFMFADEIQSTNTFIRRNTWSPDGSICLMVCGIFNDEGEKHHVVWGFNRKDMSTPAFMLPTLNKASVCTKFCPILFKKDEIKENKGDKVELLDIEYKMVFAIGTIDSIFIYNTQSITPISVITNIHCQAITDLSWHGSSTLAASSSDGYISFVVFEKNELGEKMLPENIGNETIRSLYQTYLKVDINKNIQKIHNVPIVKIVKRKEESNTKKEYEEDKKVNGQEQESFKMDIDSNINKDENAINTQNNIANTSNNQSSSQQPNQKRRIIPMTLC